MLESFEPRGGWVMVRNPDWWGKTAYPHNIDRVVHAPKADPENVAALLDGDIDLLQIPPYWALDQIRSNPGLKHAYRTKLHTMFFGLDQGSAELRASNIKGRNPFCYPNGFSVTLDCANDWGDDEIAECNGAALQLAEIGIDVAVDFLSSDEYEAKVYKDRESDFHIGGWHMEPDSEEVLNKMHHSRNELNVVGYADPRVDELIEKMKTELVTYARDAYLEEAWRIVSEDLIYLPIRHGVSVFAMRKNLEIPPDPWDVPRFRLGVQDPAPVTRTARCALLQPASAGRGTWQSASGSSAPA